LRLIGEGFTVSLSLLSAAYLISYAFEPTRLLLERYAFALTLPTIVAIVALMLQLTALAMYLLRKEVRAYIDELRAVQQNDTYEDAGAVMAALWKTGQRRGHGSHKVEILGHTLATSWTLLKSKLSAKEALRDYDIILYCLEPEPAVGSYSPVPPRWSTEAAESIASINDYVKEHADTLESRRVHVTLKSYSIYPSMHGFRLDGEDVYLTYFTWSSGRDITPYYFYERISPAAFSAAAKGRYQLFDRWLQEVDGVSRTIIARNRPAVGKMSTIPSAARGIRDGSHGRPRRWRPMFKASTAEPGEPPSGTN
jgi:hypothetical protein